MRHDPYLAHRAFIAPAWDNSAAWRIAVALLAFEIAFELTPDIILNFLPAAIGDAMYGGLSTPFGTTLEFLSFGITLIIFVGAVRLVNKRGLASLLGPGDVRGNYLRAGLWVAAVLLAIEIAPPFVDWGEIVDIRPLGPWLLWLGPALVAITIQSATEEIVYGGYLQQQLAVMTKRRIIWMGVPSVLFGAAHYFNGYGPSEGLLWAIWATFLGLACADLTARSGNLGAAIGLHAANNMFAATLYAIEDWPSSGLARYIYGYLDPSEYDYSLHTLLAPWAIWELALSAMGVLVMWLAARIALRR